MRRNFVILDEQFARSQLLFHLISKLYERVSILITTNHVLWGMADKTRR